MSLPLRDHLHMLKFLYRKSQPFCKKYIISLNHHNVYWKFCRISYTSSPCLSAVRLLFHSFPADSISFCRAAAALFCGAPYPRPVGNNKVEGRGEQLSLLSLPPSQEGSIPLAGIRPPAPASVQSQEQSFNPGVPCLPPALLNGTLRI